MVRDPQIRKQSNTVLAVAWLIRDYVNAHKGFAWPSIDKMARALGAHRSSVMRAIANLEKDGWLVVDHNRRRGNRYALNMEKVAQVRLNEQDTPRDDHLSRTEATSEFGQTRQPEVAGEQLESSYIHKNNPSYSRTRVNERNEGARHAPADNAIQTPDERLEGRLVKLIGPEGYKINSEIEASVWTELATAEQEGSLTNEKILVELAPLTGATYGWGVRANGPLTA